MLYFLTPSPHPADPAASPGLSPTSPQKRGAALLARYGGEAGPTGVANPGAGGTGSPVSLASFMGGKGAGPRLGKLSGDGRSAPPEASLIDDSRRTFSPSATSASSPSSGGGEEEGPASLASCGRIMVGPEERLSPAPRLRLLPTGVQANSKVHARQELLLLLLRRRRTEVQVNNTVQDALLLHQNPSLPLPLPTSDP